MRVAGEPSLDYAQLAALVAVAREGSFEAAAQALHISPSALSQRIKALEQSVGGVLLVRGKPSTVTPLGVPLLRHAQQVALLEQGLLSQWQSDGGADAAKAATASLAVAVNADSLNTWFVGAAADFVRLTGALIDVRVDDEAHTQEMLRRGEVLAAVSARAGAVQGCRSLRLGSLRYRATASPGFVARYFPDGLVSAAWARAPVLRFNAKDELQHRWLRRLTQLDVDPPAHRLPSTHAFVMGCEAGLGWALNPERLVREALTCGRLVDLAPEHPSDVTLYWQASRLRLPLLETLTACVQAHAREQLLPGR